MELWIGLDTDQFTARAGTFLAARIERNVLATVLGQVQDGRYSEAIFAVVTDAAGATVGAGLRTPPHHLIVTGDIDDPGAFMQAWQGLDPTVSGISADPSLARALADAWAQQTGGVTELDVSEALHVLERVTPPSRLPPGGLRPADWRESAQLIDWNVTFRIDTGLGHPELAAAAAEQRIALGQMYVWEVDGQIVSMVGHTDAIAGTVRIGPVYTPNALRGRGYATAATAALSQHLLDAGAERCMLYTDLANPISNHIYAKIGYVRIGDWEEILLRPCAD